MAPNWMKVDEIDFNSLLLLERIQIKWLFDFVSKKDLTIALAGNSIIRWYFENKCPEIKGKLKDISNTENGEFSAEEIRADESDEMQQIEDWLVYAIDPAIYDKQKFLEWDSNELTSITNYNNKVVLDIGSGTGRLAFTVAKNAKSMFCIEPVANLRDYLKSKAKKYGSRNVYVVDGLITELPFPDQFADITMGGHVFGDDLEKEYQELMRVTKKNGIVILCPGNIDKDNAIHDFLMESGFMWSRFEEPTDGMKRKYWKIKK